MFKVNNKNARTTSLELEIDFIDNADCELLSEIYANFLVLSGQ